MAASTVKIPLLWLWYLKQWFDSKEFDTLSNGSHQSKGNNYKDRVEEIPCLLLHAGRPS